MISKKTRVTKKINQTHKTKLKVLFLEAQRKINDSQLKINIDFSLLPKELFLAYSIQYKKMAENLKKELESHNIRIAGFQQVLGCTKLESQAPILLIGSGRFHAINLALQNRRVIIYNNSTNKLEEITQKEINDFKKDKQAKLNKFTQAETIGIIVSTKPGQENLALAEKTKKQIERVYPHKKVFIFLTNQLNISELENFNIDFWLNSACSGLSRDSPLISNIDDISELI